MTLRAIGNALLAAGNSLLSVCCDTCLPRFCNQSKDSCGNVIQSCGPETAFTIGPCTPECVTEDSGPCECGPETPCPLCYECVDRKCVRIVECCADGTPCTQCHICSNGVCEPCNPCQKCVDGECVPCGPCEKCDELGRCVSCDAGEICINGVCVPKQYYCCYDSPESSSSGGSPRTTSCRPATITPTGQQNPCEHGAKSGPHNSALLCQQNCTKFKCAPDACGNNRCVPDPDGPYESYNACLAACDDPCAMPCSFAGASAPGAYDIDGCERDICASYSATNGRPIRVQIYGPIMVNGCPQPGTRVVKVDSLWRCEECCDCPDTPPRSNDPRSCAGGAKGQVKWTKPRGVTSFEVAVLTACGAAYTLDIQACNTCSSRPDPGPCSCIVDSDCAPDCICCDGECIKKDAVPAGKCCGPCDGENPCPKGCDCVDGKCSACPQIVSYNGDTLPFFVGESCSGANFNNDPEGQAKIAQQWMDAIAAWMNANGYFEAAGFAYPPAGPSCTACVGPDGTCDLWSSAIFGVSACCDGVQATDFGPDWLDVFGDVFPGQDPPFYWQSFSGSPFIPPCIPNELP